MNSSQEIFNKSQSFILTAPAGSGKTECLARRYLTLLSDPAIDPYALVAITFTNKSAAEMKKRIQSYIHGERMYEDMQPIIAKMKQRINILSIIDILPIQTIDSFCTHIVQKNMGKMFRISNQTPQLYEKATTQLIETSHLQESIKHLMDFCQVDEEGFAALLQEILRRRHDWQYLLKKTNLDEFFIKSYQGFYHAHKHMLHTYPDIEKMCTDFQMKVEEVIKTMVSILLTKKGDYRQRIKYQRYQPYLQPIPKTNRLKSLLHGMRHFSYKPPNAHFLQTLQKVLRTLFHYLHQLY